MPRVDEKWGLVVCPEHLIANGVREEASSRSYRIFRVISRHETVRGGCCCRAYYLRWGLRPLLYRDARSTLLLEYSNWPSGRYPPEIPACLTRNDLEKKKTGRQRDENSPGKNTCETGEMVFANASHVNRKSRFKGVCTSWCLVAKESSAPK